MFDAVFAVNGKRNISRQRQGLINFGKRNDRTVRRIIAGGTVHIVKELCLLGQGKRIGLLFAFFGKPQVGNIFGQPVMLIGHLGAGGTLFLREERAGAYVFQLPFNGALVKQGGVEGVFKRNFFVAKEIGEHVFPPHGVSTAQLWVVRALFVVNAVKFFFHHLAVNECAVFFYFAPRVPGAGLFAFIEQLSQRFAVDQLGRRLA